MPPEVDGTRINRLADLLRTGCLDGTFGLVKPQAVLLKGQVAEIQNSADLGLEVGEAAALPRLDLAAKIRKRG